LIPDSYIAPQFGERDHPFTITGGEGLQIFTKEYGELFDSVAGYWYNVLGMRHPELLDVKQNVGGIATHLYEEYTNPFAEKLAKQLCEKTSMSNLVYSATGSMANENARKEAVHYHEAKGISSEQLVFVTIHGSYHGSVGEMLKWIDPKQNPYSIEEPIYEKTEHIGELIENYKENIENANSDGKTIAGFFYEPIMGVRGAVPLPSNYLEKIAEISQKHNILMIADEVTTGIGRTGTFLCSENFNFKPDIVCIGKAVSAGHYPVAATLFNQKIIDSWNELEKMGQSYSEIHRRGNSLVGTQEGSAISLKVLEILERDNLLHEVNEKGKYAMDKLKEIEQNSNIREIRGKGLLIGIDISNSDLAKNHITPEMRNHGINVLAEGRVIMFNPSYLISREQIDYYVNTLNNILTK